MIHFDLKIQKQLLVQQSIKYLLVRLSTSFQFNSIIPLILKDNAKDSIYLLFKSYIFL